MNTDRDMNDERAVKILFDTYWGPKGWKEGPGGPLGPPPTTLAPDFAYAKKHAVMFDPVHQTRRQTLAHLAKACKGVSKKLVTDAFVVGVSQRVPELRSALGSYAVGRRMPKHDCAKHSPPRDECQICGEYEPVPGETEDLNVLNFERLKWGGVRHTHPHYIALDLELLARAPKPKPTEQDRQVLVELLEIADSLPAKATPAQLDKATAKLLREPSPSRRTTITILAYAGILEPKKHPSYRRAFVINPPQHDSDWNYPIAWWRGNDGVNWTAVREWFPWLKQ